ncbi:MAG: biotin--[acetyl-CoA-carboxylase] ligase [Bacteroidales bacterium]|nr:biotin--[acetyl-CoA-carboxylase] ligase [Bacteroidales bacterium]MCF8390244.1 biotin--[acetyl-CoA-carboxylase] ligase [Bacteroidales bacterium]
MTIIELESTHSTNTYAAKLAPQPDMPYIIRADFQDLGRGQGDHSWESEPKKNLLFSIVFEPKHIPVDKNFFVSKFIAFCLMETIRKYNAPAMIKWPNDILVKGRKIAGILIENTIYGNSIKRCISGIGLNINQDIANKEFNAISLKEITGKEQNISVVLNDFIDVFNKNYYLLNKEGFQFINKVYFNNLFKFNQSALFMSRGSQFEAKIIDVRDDGHLVLQKSSGKLESFSFGEIEYLFSK